MPAKTEVISCPACRHLLRVPAEWLGQTVQCPECKATFTAPTRVGDRLTDPVLVSAPPPAAPAVPRPRADWVLMLPAFGLMLVGAASAVVNVWNTVRYATDPAAAERDIFHILERLQKEPEGGNTREQEAAGLAPKIRVMVLTFTVVGGLVFYGGLAIVRRRHYRMAQLGCILAAVNVANGCCVPGAVFGLWGLLMLMSDEGREHFR